MSIHETLEWIRRTLRRIGLACIVTAFLSACLVNDAVEQFAEVIATAKTLVADVTDASRLIVFESTSDSAGAFVLPDGIVPETLNRVLANDGTLAPVFADNPLVEEVQIGGDTVYVRFSEVQYLQTSTSASSLSGFRCRQVAFSLAEGNQTDAYCLDLDDGDPECYEPLVDDVQDGKCSRSYLDGGLIHAVSVQPDGTIWILSSGLIHAYAGPTAIQATPIKVDVDYFAAYDNGLLITPRDAHQSEFYVLDEGTASITTIPAVFPRRQLDDHSWPEWPRDFAWGNQILLPLPHPNPTTINVLFDTQALEVVTAGEFRYDPPVTTVGPRLEQWFTDGTYLYFPFGPDDIFAGDRLTHIYRCALDLACELVSDADRNRMRVFLEITGTSDDNIARSGGDSDIRYFETRDGQLYLMADGVISDDLSGDLVSIREIRNLGRNVYFSGVDADNQGGLFRATFDPTAHSFDFELVETYGAEVAQLIELVP